MAIGQPNLTSSIENNSFNGADNTPVLCASTGVDTSNNNKPTYPTRCAATLSFPRFALSDGKRLFIADGGNDRVLVYNSIPTNSGKAADVILGQPDEFSDNTGQNPDGTNAFQTPVSLAWDGTNLFVSDTFNRRVVVYSPAAQNIPLDGVRNAASQEIFALGTVSIAGTITEKDTVTITINGTAYTYTVVKGDTLEGLVQKLVNLINIGKGPDPNVVATANLSTLQVVLTARKPGAAGGNITYSAAVSTNATLATTAAGGTLNIYLENPSQIAPNTIITVNGKNLCDSAASADMTKPTLPFTLNNCTLYIDGVPAPLLYVSPTQINAQMPNEATDRTSVSIYSRVAHNDGTVTVSTPVATTIVTQNPGIFADPGSDPRPGIVFHASSSAFDLIGVDGNIQAGDIAAVTIGTKTYNYTVLATDTLRSVRDALISVINNAPDPLVYASAANVYSRIVLTANNPGPQGEGTSVAVSVTTDAKNASGALLILTAYNPNLCCSNVAGSRVTLSNPALPGELLYTFATGLGVTEPQSEETGRLFTGTTSNPPAVPVDSILTGGSTANVVSVGLVPGTVGVYYVQFLLSSGLSPNSATQMTIAQQAFVSNVVTFPVQVPGAASRLAVTADSSVVKPGDTVTYTVTALDYRGNIASGYGGTVAVTSSDGAATLPSNAALTAGVGTFTVTLNTIGLQTVTATDTGVSSISGTAPGVRVTATGSAAASAAGRGVPQRSRVIRR